MQAQRSRLTPSEVLSKSPLVSEGRQVAAQMPTPFVSCDGERSGDDGMGELESCLNLLYRDQVREQSEEVLALVRELGGDESRYVKERRKSVLKLVSEIYSPQESRRSYGGA